MGSNMPWFEIGLKSKAGAVNSQLVLKKFRDGTEIQSTGQALLAAEEHLLGMKMDPTIYEMQAKLSAHQCWFPNKGRR